MFKQASSTESLAILFISPLSPVAVLHVRYFTQTQNFSGLLETQMESRSLTLAECGQFSRRKADCVSIFGHHHWWRAWRNNTFSTRASTACKKRWQVACVAGRRSYNRQTSTITALSRIDAKNSVTVRMKKVMPLFDIYWAHIETTRPESKHSHSNRQRQAY
jgi:hypothetical protein